MPAILLEPIERTSTQPEPKPEPPRPTLASKESIESQFLKNVLDTVPSYVLKHAPLIHLHSKEPFWPASQLNHIKNLNFSKQPILSPSKAEDTKDRPFSILSDLKFNHETSYMTTNEIEKIRSSPQSISWLCSNDGKPDEFGKSKVSTVNLILVDKSELTGIPNTLDAFWFFFYSFNLGPKVLGVHFGNHLADWEHCMIRFIDQKPTAIHLSSHADGFAYQFESLEKEGARPIIYSAYGSHAMYPKVGKHDYSPIKVLGPVDFTDKGPRWDPLLNFNSFQHFPSPARDIFKSIGANDLINEETCSKNSKNHDDFVNCLKFRGCWGDQFSLTDRKIMRKMTLNHLRWTDGVTGPRDKDLDRIGMNRSNETILNFI